MQSTYLILTQVLELNVHMEKRYLNIVFVELERDAIGSSNHVSLYETSIVPPIL